MNINRNSLIGYALALVALASFVLAFGTLGDCVAPFVGKAVWLVPYAAVVGSVRFLARA